VELRKLRECQLAILPASPHARCDGQDDGALNPTVC
jgi:hypothetical protein